MVFALGAGKLFKLDHGGEFEETIIGESTKYLKASPWNVWLIQRITLQRNVSILSYPSPSLNGPQLVTSRLT